MVTPSIPLKTAIPRVLRISEPAPTEVIRGTTPRMKAIDVMMIGRNRNSQASSVASDRGAPNSRRFLANSTIRIAFLHARPTRTMKPTWVKMLMSILAAFTPIVEQSKHIGHDQNDRQGKRPAFVLGGEHQKDQYDGQREGVHRGAARLQLQQGQLRPDRPHRLRQLVGDQILHDLERLARAGAWRRVEVHAGRRVEVVADDHHGSADVPNLGERAQGHHAAPFATDPQAREVVDLLAEVGIALHIDLPGAAEPVEVVDVERAEIDLQRVEEFSDRYTQQLCLLAVDIQVEPGRIGAEAGEKPLQPGIAIPCRHHVVGDGFELLCPQVALDPR